MFRDFSVPQSINCARQLAKTNDFSDTPVREKDGGINVIMVIAQLNTSSIGEIFMNKQLVRELQSITGKEDKYIINVLELLGEKNTVPFIARYRKEMTGGMDEEEIKEISDRFTYLENLLELLFVQDRKSTRLNSSHVAISYAVFCLKKKTHRGDATRKDLKSAHCPAHRFN